MVRETRSSGADRFHSKVKAWNELSSASIEEEDQRGHQQSISRWYRRRTRRGRRKKRGRGFGLETSRRV
jgi:hypothetical protein